MNSLPPAYFDALYERDADPWQFETSAYEKAKYAATIAALPRAHYALGLEVGCSIGVLTAALAPRCGQLLAIDVVDTALAAARHRLAAVPHVQFAKRAFPADIQQNVPKGGFDLIVLSEVLYYLGAAELFRAARMTRAMAAVSGEVLMVHWLGPTPDYPLTGDGAAEAFIEAMQPFARVVFQARAADYRIDLLRL